MRGLQSRTCHAPPDRQRHAARAAESPSDRHHHAYDAPGREQVLKRAVLHRKNALFYRTLNGAEVGDLFMNLIHTCQFNSANSFEYLTELQRHAAQLAANPSYWMP
jgi:hypothetical protein